MHRPVDPKNLVRSYAEDKHLALLKQNRWLVCLLELQACLSVHLSV